MRKGACIATHKEGENVKTWKEKLKEKYEDEKKKINSESNTT